MTKLRSIAVAACLGLLAACSSPDGGQAAAPPVETGAPSTVDPGSAGKAGTGSGHFGHDHGAHKRGGAGKAQPGGSSSNGSQDSSNDGGTSADDGSTGDSEGNGGAARAPSSLPYPASGNYIYAQSGTEAFCDPAGNCDREDLPATQKVASTYGSRSDDEAIVVQEARMSEGRIVRTTLHFTGAAAFVTDVYYRLQYQGFDLSEEYQPDPPVPSVRFPIAAGNEWSAKWSADTSGDYHARVTGVDQVTVGDRTVDAYRIETLSHFRGEYKGKGSVVIWFDAASKTIVRTNGALDLKASYGSYQTTFETRLKSAPGF